MVFLVTKTIMIVEVDFWKLRVQKSARVKLLFSLMSYLNVLKICFYHKLYGKFEIIISSITDSVKLNTI